MSLAAWIRQSVIALGVLVLVFFLWTSFGSLSTEELQTFAEANRREGLAVFVVLMFLTTVIAPLTSLPLVPVMAPFFGPFSTGLASFIGWSLGAFAAFFIGRQFGRPLVAKFVNLDALKKYESLLDSETSFFLIVVMRMVVPVDLLSYGLAVFTQVSFSVYALATMVGIVWFSFAFAYLGDAVSNGNYVLLSVLGVASVLIVYLSFRHVRKKVRSNTP